MAKKKSAKKPAKKSVKKPAAKKPAAKKAAAKVKPVAKTAKKTAKKSVQKTAPKKPTAKMKKVTKPAAPKAAASKTAAKPVAKPAAPKAKTTSDMSKLVSPLDDRIIVEIAEVANRTPGGLFIPDSVDRADRHKQGKVVAVGRGHVDSKGKLHPLDVQLGDIVLFDHYMGAPLEISGQDVIVVRESQLLGVVKP